MEVIEGLARLGDPFLSIIARLGSDTEYTASIVQAATIAQFEACEAELAAHPHMHNICVSLQNSLLERCASHATATRLMKAQNKVPSFMQPGARELLLQRLQVDSRQYAAQVLDPAFSHTVSCAQAAWGMLRSFCTRWCIPPALSSRLRPPTPPPSPTRPTLRLP